MSGLEPCKFCGGKAKLYDDGGYYHVSCTRVNDCGAGFRKCQFDTEEEAIAAWNRRPPARMYTLEELQEIKCPVWIKELTTEPNEAGLIAGWGMLKWLGLKLKFSSRVHIRWFDDSLDGYAALGLYGVSWVAYDRPPEEETE